MISLVGIQCAQSTVYDHSIGMNDLVGHYMKKISSIVRYYPVKNLYDFQSDFSAS